jgi:hypothetical protein
MARNVAPGKLHVALTLLILFVLGLATCDGDGGVDVDVECPSKETRADKIVDEGRMMVKTKQVGDYCFRVEGCGFLVFGFWVQGLGFSTRQDDGQDHAGWWL